MLGITKWPYIMSEDVKKTDKMRNKQLPTEPHRKKVLVVDDDLLPRIYARKALEKAGYEIIEASSGDQALKILQENTIDTVLLDINMPGKSGIETCKMIRDYVDNHTLPIIIVSGNNDNASIQSAYEVGATDFVSKPVNWPILKNRLDHLLDARQMSDNYKQSEQDRHDLIDSIPDTIMRIDYNGRLIGWKHGKNESEPVFSLLSNIGINGLIPEDVIDDLYQQLTKIRNGEKKCHLEFTLSKGEETCHYEMRLFASHENEILAMVRDITQRYNDEKHIRHIAFYDQVTDIPNYVYIKQELDLIHQRCQQQGCKVGVVRLKLMGLDYINSVNGMEFGNNVLRNIADRLKSNVAEIFLAESSTKTVHVARVSGPDFILIFEAVDDEELFQSAVYQLDKVITEAYIIGEYEINVTFQIGASCGDIHVTDGFDVLKKAELALADAQKTTTKNVSIYTKDTQKRTLGQFSMRHDLRRAIENGDLHLEYQPKMSAATGKIVGAEALVRWHDKTRGRMMPDSFIPLAEESNLILTLGEFVLHEACQQTEIWRHNGYESLPIAINLSARQFNQHGLVEAVRNCMSSFSLDKNQLELEMTETTAIENGQQVSKVLNEFRENGIKTAIDDFGSGYTSLCSLRNFAFDTLKIDRSIVQYVCNDNGAASITKAIINMGHELGMSIVAEGVEDQEQFSFLKEKGCDVIQGYLTGRPMSVDDFQFEFFTA